MSDNDYLRRIQELETQLARERADKDLLRVSVNALLRETFRNEPPLSSAEIEAMMQTGGEQVRDIIREFEKEFQ